MVMSGWAKKDKQPYIYGEPYTSINRKYLQLKMRLTPYMYTLMHEAHTTGVPAVRGLVLENQTDSTTWSTSTQYEFLLGQSFLVAPVWKDTEIRDSIYFPQGKWIDYWNGNVYEGKQWLNNYAAPLDKLPLFIKAGAIIPMYPQMNYDGEKPLDTLTLDIYPLGKSFYKLYEDDGLTRAYKEGKFATTNITCNKTANSIAVSIDAIKGNYNNMLPKRNYVLQVHTTNKPSSVMINSKKISSSQYHYSTDKNGLLVIDCGKFDVHKNVVVTIQ
jgi:alpha-glucosidase (family GH31 glycosyl hydrolase)